MFDQKRVVFNIFPGFCIAEAVVYCRFKDYGSLQMLPFVAHRGWLVSAEFSGENLVEIFRALTGLFILGLKKHQVHRICNKYFIAWPGIMNISQISRSLWYFFS